MNQSQRHLYRQLVREVNRQFTAVNGSRAWAAQLRLQWLAASHPSTDVGKHDNNMHAAINALSYLVNNRKYKELLDKFNPKLSETERIEKTAKRVGLETPKSLYTDSTR